jgi:hypothetical protein
LQAGFTFSCLYETTNLLYSNWNGIIENGSSGYWENVTNGIVSIYDPQNITGYSIGDSVQYIDISSYYTIQPGANTPEFDFFFYNGTDSHVVTSNVSCNPYITYELYPNFILNSSLNWNDLNCYVFTPNTQIDVGGQLLPIFGWKEVNPLSAFSISNPMYKLRITDKLNNVIFEDTNLTTYSINRVITIPSEKIAILNNLPMPIVVKLYLDGSLSQSFVLTSSTSISTMIAIQNISYSAYYLDNGTIISPLTTIPSVLNNQTYILNFGYATYQGSIVVPSTDLSGNVWVVVIFAIIILVVLGIAFSNGNSNNKRGYY